MKDEEDEVSRAIRALIDGPAGDDVRREVRETARRAAEGVPPPMLRRILSRYAPRGTKFRRGASGASERG